jgi:hypothetical protein
LKQRRLEEDDNIHVAIQQLLSAVQLIQEGEDDGTESPLMCAELTVGSAISRVNKAQELLWESYNAIQEEQQAKIARVLKFPA